MKNKTPKKRKSYKGGAYKGGDGSYTITYEIGNQVSPIDGMASTGTIGQWKNKKSTARDAEEAIKKVKDKLKAMGTCPELTAKLNYHVTCSKKDDSVDSLPSESKSLTRYNVDKSFLGISKGGMRTSRKKKSKTRRK